jgi:hypothetical protein
MALSTVYASGRKRVVFLNDTLHLCKTHRLNRIENAKMQSVVTRLYGSIDVNGFVSIRVEM